MKVSSSWSAVESMSWSILGKGKLSLGHALFKSMKSIHILHFSLDFFYHDDIGQPFGLVNLSNKSCSQELFYFFHNCFVSLWGKYLSLLLDGLLHWVNKTMLYHMSINSRHIFMAPCKDIQILFQKLHLLVFLWTVRALFLPWQFWKGLLPLALYSPPLPQVWAVLPLPSRCDSPWTPGPPSNIPQLRVGLHRFLQSREGLGISLLSSMQKLQP